MARIKTALLVAEAIGIIDRADYVRKDPAVIGAARRLVDDVHQVGRSAVDLGQATVSAWNRSGEGRRPVGIY